ELDIVEKSAFFRLDGSHEVVLPSRKPGRMPPIRPGAAFADLHDRTFSTNRIRFHVKTSGRFTSHVFGELAQGGLGDWADPAALAGRRRDRHPEWSPPLDVRSRRAPACRQPVGGPAAGARICGRDAGDPRMDRLTARCRMVRRDSAAFLGIETEIHTPR